MSASNHAFARVARAAWFDPQRFAIDGHGNQPRRGGFAYAAWTAKQIGMTNSPAFQGWSQHIFNVFLPNDFIPVDWSRALINRGHGFILSFPHETGNLSFWVLDFGLTNSSLGVSSG